MLEELEELKGTLGARVTTDQSQIDRTSRDASRYSPEGAALAVVFAEETADVSAALAWAHKHSVQVSIRGGGSGLAGGAVAYSGGLIISLERMNRVFRIDGVNKLADVEAGVISADLDRAAREHGLFFAPDPASVELSTVGGNIATNAGGLRCISHGVTRDSVAALEVVLADGTVLHTGARTRKNVVGLDLTSLFVGSEGTLGVITAATVRLQPIAPGTPQTFRVSFDEIEAAGRAVSAIMAENSPPEVLELLDAHSVAKIEEYFPSGLPSPKAALLIGQTVGLDSTEQANAIVQMCLAHGGVDPHLSDDDSLLEARRLANPALSATGLRVSCDIGVPVSELANVFRGIAELSEKHGRGITVIAHAGDGNLHPTVEADDTVEGRAAAEAVIVDMSRLAVSLGGTISGEHGIGAVKHHELGIQMGAAERAVQLAIKATLDERNILTPGRAI